MIRIRLDGDDLAIFDRILVQQTVVGNLSPTFPHPRVRSVVVVVVEVVALLFDFIFVIS